MQSTTACLVDEQGYYTRFVMVHMAEDGTQRLEVGEIQPDEQIVFNYRYVPSDMIRPRWDGHKWEETASAEEVKAARPEPSPPAPPSEIEILRQEVDAALMELAGGLAEQETINQDQDNAIMEIGGMISG